MKFSEVFEYILGLYWDRIFWFEPEMVLTLSFLSSKLFIYVGLLSILAIYLFIFFLSLWSLFIKIWWNSELPTTLSFFGRNILIHFSDVGLLPSVPSTGWEVKYLLLHLRHKINSFNCYFVFSSYQSVLYVCRIGNKQFLKIKCN